MIAIFFQAKKVHPYNTSLSSRYAYARTKYGIFNIKFVGVKVLNSLDQELKTLQTKFQIASNWVNDYYFQTNIHWRRDFHVTASLEALEEEHSLKLLIDATYSAIELMLKSPLLPVNEITFTGEISNPLDFSKIISEVPEYTP